MRFSRLRQKMQKLYPEHAVAIRSAWLYNFASWELPQYEPNLSLICITQKQNRLPIIFFIAFSLFCCQKLANILFLKRLPISILFKSVWHLLNAHLLRLLKMLLAVQRSLPRFAWNFCGIFDTILTPNRRQKFYARLYTASPCYKVTQNRNLGARMAHLRNPSQWFNP